MTLELTCTSKCIRCRKEYELRYCNNRLCSDCKVLNKKENSIENNRRVSLMRQSVIVPCSYCNKPISGYHGKRFCSGSCRTRYHNIPKKLFWAENEILVLQEKIKKWRSIMVTDDHLTQVWLERIKDVCESTN